VIPADPYARLAGVYDEIVVDPSYGRMAAFAHRAWGDDEAGVREVLDVCCGTGLMAAELIALGYRVTGVDASAQMLARARHTLGPGVALVEEALPSLTIDAVFDAAVSTFDGLNYLTPPDLRATLAAVARRIRPGGWLVFDAHTEAMMEFTVANPVVEGEKDGWRFAITNTVDVPARTCDSRIEVTRESDGDAFVERHRQHFFTGAQIDDALAAAGFDLVEVTDDYGTEPADGSSLRPTWVARRRSSTPG
jgi:SAM-dependent methyltransferase